ncbi:MAG: hypothetical protein K2N85_09625 [Lachnospiraceae bacterium]|nr:hypothetical protein [Lachnospiraceae bacterium]
MNEELVKNDIKRSFKWKEYLRTAVMGIFTVTSAFVWWFLLYPELCFPEDTYEIVYEEQGMEEDCSDEDIFSQLMLSDEGQLVIKSRILEWIRKNERK